MITFRKTAQEDFPLIKNVDKYFSHHENRHKNAIIQKSHFSAWEWQKMIWLVIFDYELFWNAFIRLLMTTPKLQRKWIATTLVSMCETACRNDRLFISTQKTNNNMLWLLKKSWYLECGSVKFLNEDIDDDELFFYKNLQ